MDENTDLLPQGLTMCGENRPAYCTREFIPVCGYMPASKAWKTFPNKCEACRNTDVIGYKAEKCSADNMQSGTTS